MTSKNHNDESLVISLCRRIYRWKIFNPFRKHIEPIKLKIEKSLRSELIAVIALCFIASFVFYGVANNFLSHDRREANVTYNYGNIRDTAKEVASEAEKEGSVENSEFFNELFSRYSSDGSSEIYITDLDGNIIYKSNNVNESKVDIFSLLSNISNDDKEDGSEKKYVFPIKVGETRCYLVYTDTPEPTISYETYEVTNSFLALILSIIVFSVLFVSVINKKMKYLDEIASGLKVIANEDLKCRIREDGDDELTNLASNINYMAGEINNKIMIERRAEQTKTDLITNVSHDLRTPLTSIMGYIGLVKEGKYANEEEMKNYLNIAFNKSEKLKMLIEDLFEYTKLNNDGIRLKKTNANLIEFLFQLSEELMPLFDENNLKLIKSAKKDEKIMVNIDPDKMVRVFENIFSNAVKYSYKPGNIVMAVSKYNDYALVVIRNKGDNIPKEKIERLFDRFYRVDESRNAQTGGTGLGLAISKNIVELHGGTIWAECYGNDISFYVKIKCL